MSETQKPDTTNSPNPEVTPQQKKTFTRVLGSLMKFARENGDSLTVHQEADEALVERSTYWNETTAERLGIEFTKDSRGGEVHLETSDGIIRAGWLYANDESGLSKSGILATLALQPSLENYWEQDIWELHTDGNVELLKYHLHSSRDVEKGETFDELEHDHWLSEQEVDQLGILAEGLRAGWPEFEETN